MEALKGGRLRQVWSGYDHDGSGQVSYDEVQRMMVEFNIGIQGTNPNPKRNPNPISEFKVPTRPLTSFRNVTMRRMVSCLLKPLRQRLWISMLDPMRTDMAALGIDNPNPNPNTDPNSKPNPNWPNQAQHP